MGVFNQIIEKMQSDSDHKKDLLYETEGLSAVLNSPECFCTPQEDLSGIIMETSEWLSSRVSRGLEVSIDYLEDIE